MIRVVVSGVLAAGIVMGSTASAAGTDFNYKNPANPTKTAAKLKDSQYRGWHYEKRWEKYRKCVMARESGGNYKANGPYGSGSYQFIQSTWNTAMERANMPEWIGVRPHKAPPFVQDAAFWIMANPYPKKPALHGRNHWSPRWAKETLGVNVHDC